MRHRSRLLRKRLAATTILSAALLGGCDARSESLDAREAALRDSLGVAPEVPLHRVALSGGPSGARVMPAEVILEEGDFVDFYTLDGRVHTVGFEADSLAPAMLDFLHETLQLESPPLVVPGSHFLLDFAGAPAGRYVYSARAGGDPVIGVLTVETPGS